MKIEQRNNKDYILCSWRRRWVRLTPEEWVRQQFLTKLVCDYGYPAARIGVEAPIRVGDVQKRIDAMVVGTDLRPLLLLEFKREDVQLTQKVLDQASVYNRTLHVPYLIISNGRETIVARVTETAYDYLPGIPTWTQLSN